MTTNAGNGAPGPPEPADTIPISALQHYLFCPRQCALIHVERMWAENRFTAEGRILHETVHDPGERTRAGIRIARSLPLASARLGVVGIADVVEFPNDDHRARPFPVEYKRGRPKAHRADEVQLCAQAIALEEMFAVNIASGALFYGKTRRRKTVAFDEALRALTAQVAARTREMIDSGRTPPPVYDRARCDTCSLFEACRPKALERRRSVATWLARQLATDEA